MSLRLLLMCLITISALHCFYFMQRFEGETVGTPLSTLSSLSELNHSEMTNITKAKRLRRSWRESRVVNTNNNATIVIPYDEAGQSLVTFGTLPLFPVEHKIRLDVLNSTDLYVSTVKGKFGTHKMCHFVYNPTLLPLTNKSLQRIGIEAGGAYAKAAYLGTFRISNFGHCRGPIQGLKPTGNFRNYLGLALFDGGLEQLRDSSTYFKLRLKTMKPPKRVPPSSAPTERFFNQWDNALQDCSLYDKHNRFHLLCNGYIAPVTILTSDSREFKSFNGDTQPASVLGGIEASVEFRKGGGKLRLIQDHPWIPLQLNGKNLHIFEDIHNNTYLEVWPTSPKHSIRVRLEEEDILRMTWAMMNSPLHYHNNTILSEHFYNNKVSSRAKTTLPPQQPSFLGPMEDMWEPLSNPLERGTACCITVFLRERDKASLRNNVGDDGVPLRVGVVHLKDEKANYLNRFYAFEPIAPFREVAKSGSFCLGFGENDSTVTTERPELMREEFGNVSTLNVFIVDRHYDCPKIQFVSGITEKVDDPNSVILSYGINDCYSRMVVVPKDAILDLLFPN